MRADPWYSGTASDGSCSTPPLGRCCQTGRFVVCYLSRYVATEEVGGDGLTADLAAAVEAANEDAPWREESLVMLTLEEDMRAQGRLLQKKGREEGLAEGRAEGRAAGRAEGADQLGKLIAQLMDAGRFEDARRAATDAEYREGLLEELDS